MCQSFLKRFFLRIIGALFAVFCGSLPGGVEVLEPMLRQEYFHLNSFLREGRKNGAPCGAPEGT